MIQHYRRSRRNRTRQGNFTRKKFSPFFSILICIFVLVSVVFGGYYYFPEVFVPNNKTDGIDVKFIKNQELSIHFLELGNKTDGDCTFIKTGNTEVLIDAGSDYNSIPVIKNYLDQYIEDGIIEYVIVTHAHKDHYAGFATPEGTESLFDIYNVETVIQFALATEATMKNNIYNNYINELNELKDRCKTKIYTAQDCIAGTNGAQKKYSLSASVDLEILDQCFYRTVATTENNHSVCCQVIQNQEKYYLFTGDLEKEGEESLIASNPTLNQVDLYKAGHHGSNTSSTQALLSIIDPKNIAVSCCAGGTKYNFPTQEFINRIAEHTTSVYITTMYDDNQKTQRSMNGNIVFYSNKTDTKINVACSSNTTILKNTAWFKSHRNQPKKWSYA